MENRPTIPLPNAGEGGAAFPGDAAQTPSIPLPNPGEGGPAAPGPSGVIIQPLPGFVPIPQPLASVRMLSAACGYPPLSLYIGDVPAAGPLEAGSLSAFVRLAAGRYTVTLTDSSGYIYLQTRLRFAPGARTTLCVLLRAGGLELVAVEGD